MNIEQLKTEDYKEVSDFVLDIQNNEFGLGFLPHEQPDLLNLEEFYKGGGFWVIKDNGKIVGTIGLQKLNKNIAILRKMFVKKELRSNKPKLAQILFEELISEAKQLKFNQIYLDTPAVANASHRFYEKNGFLEVTDKTSLPEIYKYPDRNSKIYTYQL